MSRHIIHLHMYVQYIRVLYKSTRHVQRSSIKEVDHSPETLSLFAELTSFAVIIYHLTSMYI